MPCRKLLAAEQLLDRNAPEVFCCNIFAWLSLSVSVGIMPVNKTSPGSLIMKRILFNLSSIFSESIPARRRECRVSSIGNGVEACECREYLSAMPVVPDLQAEPRRVELPAAEISSNFTGTWTNRSDRFHLEQRRDRVRGTYVGNNIEAGAKIRANVEGDHLVGTIRGRAEIPGMGSGRFKIDLDAHRTRSNQFEANLQVSFNGRQFGEANLVFTRS